MRFHIITLFPDMFDSYLHESILARAIKQKKIKISFYDPRNYVTGKYKKMWPDGNVSRQADDRPYGGGPGMVVRAEPVLKAVERAISRISHPSASPSLGTSPSQGRTVRKRSPKIKLIFFSPNATAKKFDTNYAKVVAKKYTDIILICGRYEGIDSRVQKIYKAESLSIGDYVLTGGELPAMILIDSISRQISGVLGNFDSREEERVSSSEIYTRPEVLEYKGKKYKVPKVLLSGDHKKIEEWKKKI